MNKHVACASLLVTTLCCGCQNSPVVAAEAEKALIERIGQLPSSYVEVNQKGAVVRVGIWIDEGRTGADVLPELARCKQLTAVDLRGRGVVDDDLCHVGKIEGIQELTITVASVCGRGFRLLAGARKLRALYCYNTSVTDEGAAGLVHLSHLRHLVIVGAPLGDDGAAAIGSMHSLVALKLVMCNVTDRGVAALEALKSLEHLDLSRNEVTDVAVVAIKSLPKLREVFMNRTLVTENGLAEMADMKSLRRVEFIETSVSEAGSARLAAMNPCVRWRGPYP